VQISWQWGEGEVSLQKKESKKSPFRISAHTKRLLDKTSPRQNVSIQNVSTHNVSLTKRLLNDTSPVTKLLRHKTSPVQFYNDPDKLLYNNSQIEFSPLQFG
jgi:hypothetical protein